MKLANLSTFRPLLAGFCLALFVAVESGQQQPPAQTDDVIRINTDLAQTAVIVVDKNGKFVDGLQREQFELRVDGKPQPISFFERVTAGSAREKQLATRGNSSAAPLKATPERSSTRGRTIIFFIDDLHLSLQSVDRTRKTIMHFIESEMGPRDLVAIASASGQIGFLEQFTDNKEVLKAAVARLIPRPYVVRGYEMNSSPMSEYIALMIDTKSDRNVMDVYIEECMKQSQLPKRIKRAVDAIRMTCETQVKNSARSILAQATAITENTYLSLERLMRSSAALPGRKLAFVLSDGFLLDTGPRNASLVDKLQRITDAAQRAGVVIYTIDAKGLMSGLLDATNNVVPDPNGRLQTIASGEIAASQDALNALAGDTGGRALRNQNTFDRWVAKVLDETSNYYLLAWRPETEAQKNEKFRRVEVSITGRPDLTARLPRGYIEGAKVALTASNSLSAENGNSSPREPSKSSGVELRDALTDFYTRGTLPTLLSLSYLSTPDNGMMLISSMQIAGNVLAYGADGKQPATVDLAGVVLNDKGKIVTSFKNQLNVKPLASDAARPEHSGIIYNHHAPLKPGIYQVRVAARDDKSGLVGSAMQWVVIPDLTGRQLALSSLLLGGQVLETAQSKGSIETRPEPQIQFSVDHHFSRSSHLDFWVFVYNASQSSGAVNLTVQAQVWRDGQAIVTTPQRPLTMNGMTDMARIPYSGTLRLNNLTAGLYELRVIVTDLSAKTTAAQSAKFDIE